MIETIDSKLYSLMVDKSLWVDDVTDNEVVDYIKWNDEVMLSGVKPYEDLYGRPLEGGGEPLAGGWRASFSG